MAFGSTCLSQVRTCTNGALSGTFPAAACAVTAAVNCLFNGRQIAHNTTATAWEAATVPFGSTCRSQVRTCTNGVLSGNYAAASCAVANAESCSFNGQTVAHNGTVTAWETGSVAFGSTCRSQVRTCTNGALSGTYAVASCSVGAAATCSFNGQNVANNANVTAWESATVPFGSSCRSEVRTCANGTLSGTYSAAVCAVAAGASCNLNGQTIAHAGTVTAWETATVAFGSTCRSQVRTCTNGVLSGTYAVASCSVGAAATCSFNGQNVGSGSQVLAWEAASVPYGQSCRNEYRTCTNGTLSGTFGAASCAAAAAASCTLNGQTIAHNGSVTVFEAASVPASSYYCKQETRWCTNGVLSGSYTAAVCVVNAPRACTFNGQPVANSAWVYGYETATVPYGSTCKQQFRMCTDGTLSGTYAAATCTVDGPSASSIQLMYAKSFYDPTVDASLYEEFSETDVIDLGEVPADEIATQVLPLKIKNTNASVVNVNSPSSLSKSKLSPNLPYSVAGASEVSFTLSPQTTSIGDFTESWIVNIATKKYTIRIKGRIIP